VILALSACSSAGVSPSGSGGSGGGGSSGGGADAPGVTAHSVTLGLLMPLTGSYAAAFADVKIAFDARIALENAEGGVYGRQLVVDEADDQTSPTGVLAAARTLVQAKDVFAIGTNSPVLIGAYKYLGQQGVPVVGADADGGPEWTPANPNLFAVTGSSGPNPPAAAAWGLFLKSQGVTNVGSISNPFPGATKVVTAVNASAEAAGLKASYLNTTIPVTQASGFGGPVQTMMSQGVDGVMTGWTVEAGFGLLKDAVAAGFRQKVKVWIMAGAPTGADLSNPQARQLASGTWTMEPVVPPEANVPAAAAFNAAVAKYEHVTRPLTDLGVEGWLTASAIVEGLKLAGPHPTRAAFISKLRAVNDFSGDGMEIQPVSFTASVGENADFTGPVPGSCLWFMQYQGGHYVAQAKPVCAGNVK
jgi:ABC-type branched-subunit amino acid transport system substrate-binding protein